MTFKTQKMQKNQFIDMPSKEFINNIFGDAYLPSINGNRFSEIAYSTYFDIEILPELSKQNTFYIFIGSDSGMLLKHLKLLNLDTNSLYFIIEDPEITRCINKHILQLTDSNIIVSSLDSWKEQAKDAGIVKYIEVDRLQKINSFSAKDAIYQPYFNYAQKLHEDINQLKWIHPDKFQKKIYLQRQLENCSENFNPVIKLKALLKGKPALILAGGPSLNDYIDWIEKYQQHYVVIAASRIAKRLLTTKIVPDIFVTADPFDDIYLTSKEVLAFGEKSILVSQNYAHPKIIGQWQGRHFYLGNLLPWDADYKHENITAIGPTVTNCAIHLAIQMGIYKQILFGVDLCYSASGVSHASSTNEKTNGPNLGFMGVSVQTNNNKTAETTFEFSQARTSIALLGKLAKEYGGKLINPSPDSAVIEHVAYLPIDTIQIPDDLTDGYLLISNGLEDNTLSERLRHYSKILEEHNKVIKETEQILLYTKEIIALCSLSQNNEIQSEALSRLVASAQILEKHSKVISIIESFGTNGYYDFFHPDKISESEHSLSHIERYYCSLSIACDAFIEFISNSMQRIQIRIMEYSEQTDIKQLAAQWQQDGQFGRILLLRDNNLCLYNQFKKEKQQEFEKNFNKIFNVIIQKQSYEQPPAIRLENIEKKLYHFFQYKDKNNITLIIQQISHYTNEESAALIHLAQGYLCELDGQIDRAINEYLEANSEQTLESGLKRILAIMLEQDERENVIMTLKALSNISPDYLIQLAGFYQLFEQNKDALESYTQYLDVNSKDILVLIKMGLLYHSLDISDGMEFVFKHILEIDPNNQTAATYLKQNTGKSYVLGINNLSFELANLRYDV